MIQRLAVIICILVTCGCFSRFDERHFFMQKTGQEIPNYFRLKVEGYSFISSSRYLSGYFDEDTLNTYFNEYTQPTGGALVPISRSSDDNKKDKVAVDQKKQNGNDKIMQSVGDQKESKIQPVSASLRGKNLIMILSTNSEEVTNQIGALASSKQFTASLAGILARDKYTAADSAESRLSVEKSLAKTTSELAKQLATGLDKDKPVQDTEPILIGFINTLASDLGYDVTFNKLEDAERWFRFSRARLLRGDR